MRNRLLLTSFLFGVVPIKLVTDHLTRWIHNPDTRDDITLVLARKRPAPE